MSVPVLISRLVTKLVLEESAVLEDESGRKIGGTGKSGRSRRKANDTVKHLKLQTFQTLISISPKHTVQFDVHRAIREELVGVEVETGNSRATELASKITKRNESVGPAIVYMLLAFRNSAERTGESEQPESAWWFSQQGLIRNPDSIIKGANPLHALQSDPDFFSFTSLRDDDDARERGLIERALEASRKPSCLPDGRPLTGLDRVERLLGECEQILQRHQSPVSFIRATFCYEVETILSDVSGKLHGHRHEGIRSLLELEKRAKPLLATCEGTKLVLLHLKDRENSSQNVVEAYFDSLHELAGQSRNRRVAIPSLGKATIALHIYQELLRQMALSLTEFFSFNDRTGKSSIHPEIAYENPSCQFVSGLPRPESSRLILILPAVLGGKSLAHKCSYARELGLRYLPHFSVRFGDGITKHSIEEACSRVELQVLMHVTPLVMRAMEHWRQTLLFRQEDEAGDSIEKNFLVEKPEELLPGALLDTMKRCLMVLSVIDQAQQACISEFEMSHLVRGLNAFFLQSIDFDIFPRLLAAIRSAHSTEDILDALDQAQEDLCTLFFLDDDVRFLTMESLLDAMHRQDVVKFRKCRAFFVKCLLNTSSGRYFLDILDQNGFYRKCAEQFGSATLA